MMRSPVFLGSLFLGWCLSVSLAEDSLKPIADAPESVKAFLKYSESQRRNHLQWCETRIQEIKKTRGQQMTVREEKSKWKMKGDGTQGTFRSKAEKAENLKLLDEQIKLLDTQIEREEKLAAYYLSVPLFTEIPEFMGEYEVGIFGTFTNDRFFSVVVQIVDEENMLLAYRNVGDRSGPTVWIRGVSTTGYADGKGIKLNQIFHVTGTKKYNTAVGATKTVYLFEPFDVTSAAPFAPKQVVPKPVVKDVAEDVKPKPAKEPDQQMAASQKLTLAKSLLKLNPTLAKKRLEELIVSFPTTDAANEAQKLLNGLK